MLTLVLTRHGFTDRSEPEQHLGQRIDISLNIAGTRQAQALGRRLAPVRFDRVLTSPLFRARETAAILARGVPVEADPRLREMDYGDWEGRAYADILASDGQLRRDWEQAPDVIRCPRGESGDDVAKRVHGFIADLLEEHARWQARAAFRATAGSGGPGGASSPAPARPGGPPADRPILAVAHSTMNRILMCVALGIPIRDYRRRFVQAQANITVLRWETGAGPADASLLLANDVEHLRAATDSPWA
jgi:broad specificity phosphatase PhoE